MQVRFSRAKPNCCLQDRTHSKGMYKCALGMKCQRDIAAGERIVMPTWRGAGFALAGKSMHLSKFPRIVCKKGTTNELSRIFNKRGRTAKA